MIIKKWFYENGIEGNPVPVVIVRIYTFMTTAIVQYRKVIQDGLLGPEQECVGQNAPELFGFNAGTNFPEISVEFCPSCGYIIKDK